MAITRFTSTVNRTEPRTAERQRVALPARLTWKDASGAVRFASVMTRDVSDVGAFVEADNSAAIPLHRLVHIQLERNARDLAAIPHELREGRVLSAVWRVGPYRPSKGTPGGYALRFLVDPRQKAGERTSDERMAVAS